MITSTRRHRTVPSTVRLLLGMLLLLPLSRTPLTAQTTYLMGLLNLDPESTVIWAEARYADGQVIYTDKVSYSMQSGTSGGAVTDKQPEEIWFNDTAGNRRVVGFPMYPIYTAIVVYGPGKYFTYNGSSADDGITSVHEEKLFGTFHGLSSTTVYQQIQPLAHTDFTFATQTTAMTEFATLGLSDDSWWVMMGEPSSKYIISMADDTIAVGQVHTSQTPATWALKIDPERDSGRFRTVNATTVAGLEIEIDGSARGSCGALSTTAPLTLATGERRIRLIDQGTTLVDTTVRIFPHIYLDLLIAPNGSGGFAVVLSERLTSEVASRITRGPIGLDGKHRYWPSTYRTVIVPTGPLRKGSFQVRDTSTAVIFTLALNSAPVQRQLVAAANHHRALDLVDSNGMILKRCPLDAEAFDSTVYIVREIDGEIVASSYNEFDDRPQQLDPLPGAQSPADIPYSLRVAGFSRQHDDLELRVDGEVLSPVRREWASDTSGSFVGSSLPYALAEPGGSQLAEGALTGSPGGHSVLIVDDAPGGGLRTLSYAVHPSQTPRTIRLMNATEGIGPLKVTGAQDPTQIVFAPVNEGAVGYPTSTQVNAYRGVIRSADNDTLFSYTIPPDFYDATLVVDGSHAEGMLRLYRIDGKPMTGADTLHPIATRELISSVPLGDMTAERFRLFPNPASSTLDVDILEGPAGSGRVDIADMMGRVVRSVPYEAGERSLVIPVTTLAPGIYYCRLRTDGGFTSASTRLMILR